MLYLYLYGTIFIYSHFMKLNIYNSTLLLLIAVCSTLSVHAQYISAFAGNSGTSGYSGDGGVAISAKLNSCSGVAVDGAGNIYIADRGNHVVRKISTAGTISTFAGTGTAGYSGNGGAASLATLNMPGSVATDAAGNVYISDIGNNTVRMVNTMGIIRNFAGSGVAGYAGDGDTAHNGRLNAPEGLAVDAAGNVYIADAGNNVIRMVSAGLRLMSTVAGNGLQGYSGDGGSAVLAKLYNPSGVAVDINGNLYIADVINNRVRKVATSGIISTYAGTGTAGNSGNGGAAAAATLRYPSALSVDGAGNLYIADQGNNNIRMVSTSGVITNFAGTSTSGYDGDGGLAVSARLAAPKCVTADGWGRVYIADAGNHAVRVVSATASVSGALTSGKIAVYPNPSSGTFTLSMPLVVGSVQVSVLDIMGRVAATKNLSGAATQQLLDFSSLAPGSYILKVTAGEAAYTTKLTIE